MKVYKNKVDVFHYILYGFVNLFIVIAIYFLLTSGGNWGAKIVTIIFLIIVEIYLTTIYFFSSYYFTKDRLVCKLGKIELGYVYERIKSVKECNSISLLFNTSVRCIKIKGVNIRTIRVSPDNIDEFLKEMGKHGFLMVKKDAKKVGDKK